MIQSRKAINAIEFARNDFKKFDNVAIDYVFYSSFPHQYIRFSDGIYKDCYEKDILTGEIPNEPTFQFWEMSNVRKYIVPDDFPIHEWNLAMLREGFKVKEGETVKLEYT